MPAHLVAYVLDFLVAFAGAAAVYAYWLANRRRLAAETLGRAEEQARAIVREAEREGDTRRKEALLDAKERAHDLRVEAEQFARDHRQQITGMEQVLARREASLAEQQQTAERRLQAARAPRARAGGARAARRGRGRSLRDAGRERIAASSNASPR